MNYNSNILNLCKNVVTIDKLLKKTNQKSESCDLTMQMDAILQELQNELL